MGFINIDSDSNGNGALEIVNSSWERHIYAWKEFNGAGVNYASDIEIRSGLQGTSLVYLPFCNPGNNERRACSRAGHSAGSPNDYIFVRYDTGVSCGTGTVTTPTFVSAGLFTEIFTIELPTFKLTQWKARIDDHQSVRITIIIENDNSGTN